MLSHCSSMSLISASVCRICTSSSHKPRVWWILGHTYILISHSYNSEVLGLVHVTAVGTFFCAAASSSIVFLISSIYWRIAEGSQSVSTPNLLHIRVVASSDSEVMEVMELELRCFFSLAINPRLIEAMYFLWSCKSMKSESACLIKYLPGTVLSSVQIWYRLLRKFATNMGWGFRGSCFLYGWEQLGWGFSWSSYSSNLFKPIRISETVFAFPSNG